MNETNALNQVAEFHRTFQHPILEAPTIPSANRCSLRVSLISEELDELKQAIADKNIKEIADALCDIQYVLAGAIHEFGLGEKFKVLFDEVHRSNMSKACKTEAEAIATVNHYAEKENTPAHFVEKDGMFLVFRDNDHKTLKSINYSPADLVSKL
ncbi:nucleoside triphosphate pyrophosphohydrolase family protein [Pedobacter sp. MR22-3]|uniref:nucleoside triphosphate pyrophosphohydrolase family protein n=1 Tax=Pedobacter sp. MR22-3 TaxID=2994552 RepID=UPI0022462474|nr:nucleoside triphosphate pyrophosphohydrolase family protein [Pedobacter sp. MR22-3]MCX2584799.1 nucleoside triphosphate pyrophosphohydrolase family protein [Pedobacter sp. MR22-3]